MTDSDPYTLEATGLEKKYKHRVVVNNVNIKLQSDEVVGLLGPNGAGKTTCFYMMVGLVSGDLGHIHLNGQDITKLSMHERARRGIGYLPQEPSIFRKLSVENNILAILELRTDLNRDARHTLLESLLDEFNLQKVRDALGMTLSGGERRRVEIARALAMEPGFILLDEPFAGVDPIAVDDIKEIISHLRDHHVGVLITDHNVRETLSICDRAYILSEGAIIAEGAPQTLLENKKVRDVYLGKRFELPL